MKLHEMTSIVDGKKKRIGRGYGSGKGGHTVGRGQKGQKARYSIPQWFVGTSWVWFKRLPMMRGKSKFQSLAKPTLTLTLTDLNSFKASSVVNTESLLKQNILTERQAKSSLVKILGTGKLEKALKVALPASKSAIQAIKKAGGEYISETD